MSPYFRAALAAVLLLIGAIAPGLGQNTGPGKVITGRRVSTVIEIVDALRKFRRRAK